jgi:endonuclease/exonuclease/phosphatase family metal-dependent hydrolase
VSLASIVPLITMLLITMIAGCGPAGEVKQPEKVEPVLSPKEPTPAITINVATLNLSKAGTKYEKQYISKMADIIKQEDIQLISLQGVTRYPEVSSRVDFIDELRLQTDMYQKFGETQNYSGRQIGNAVLSAYPVKNSENIEYKKLKTFSTALATSIDAGVGNVVFVSTLLPDDFPLSEKINCIELLVQIQKKYQSVFFIVAGNVSMLGNDNLKDYKMKLGEIKSQNISSQVTFVQNEALKLLNTATVDTHYGTMQIYKFGLFNQSIQKK